MHFHSLRLVSVTVGGLAITLHGSVHAQTAVITVIPDTIPVAVSADGSSVIGSLFPGVHSFYWTVESGVVTIDASSAWQAVTAVSDDGEIVVGARLTGEPPFKWTLRDGFTSLVPGSCMRTVPESTDASGKLIAAECSGGVPAHIVTWNGGAWSSIGFGSYDLVHDPIMSADGSTIALRGENIDESDFYLALYQGGAFQELGLGVPHDLTPDGGVVVGVSDLMGLRQACRWTAASGIQILDPEPSQALAVSADGATVLGGRLGVPDGWIWSEAGGRRDLRTVLTNDYGLELSGFVSLSAVDISADATVLVLWAGQGASSVTLIVDLDPPPIDSDGDGLLNSWETDGIPYVDADGVEQLYLLDWNQDGVSDADPQRKDIFVEVDAMQGTGIAPTMADLQPVIDAFARAPVSNPGGIDGVRLHIQLSDLNLPLQAFPDGFTQFDTLKADWFGTAADLVGEPATVEAVLETKKKAYRYCIFALNYGSDGSSGLAELPGNDFMVTLGDWTPPGGSAGQKAGTFMHELGHTLGLTHKGPLSELSDAERTGDDEHYNLKPNYYSVMNYNWQIPYVWHTPGSWPLASLNSGYSSAPLRMLDETDLIESEGLVPVAAENIYPAPGFKVPHNIEVDPAQPHDNRIAIVRIGGGIDWNGDGVVDPLDPITRDVNRVRSGWPSSPDTTLHGYADWPHLVYDFVGLPTFADGVHGDTEEEMTFADSLAFDAMLPPNCDGDIALNDQVDVGDLLAMLSAWGPCASGVVCVEDIDQDGNVGVGDLLSLLANWGPCP